MNYSYLAQKQYNAWRSQLICVGYYILPAIVIMAITMWLREKNPAIFHLLLFSWGWVSWTFVEYLSHRFWMHSSKSGDGDKNDFANHHYHHTHPTEIRVTPLHRLILCAGFLVLVFTAIRLNGYFTLVTGFFAGFTLYFYMHVLLHKSWAAKIVGRLQEYHIYHHCKYTNRCFGVTVTWWDRVFGTTPPPHAKIPDRIRAFYFGADYHHSTTSIKNLHAMKKLPFFGLILLAAVSCKKGDFNPDEGKLEFIIQEFATQMPIPDVTVSSVSFTVNDNLNTIYHYTNERTDKDGHVKIDRGIEPITLNKHGYFTRTLPGNVSNGVQKMFRRAPFTLKLQETSGDTSAITMLIISLRSNVDVAEYYPGNVIYYLEYHYFYYNYIPPINLEGLADIPSQVDVVIRRIGKADQQFSMQITPSSSQKQTISHDFE